MKSAPTIVFDYRPSWMVAGACVLVMALAVLAVMTSGLPVFWRIGLSLLATGWSACALLRFLFPRFRRIAFGVAGWMLVTRSDEESIAQLRGQARLGVLLSLEFAVAGRGRWTAILAPDNLDAATRRRLILLFARGEVLHAR